MAVNLEQSLALNTIDLINSNPSSLSLSDWKSAWLIIQALEDPDAPISLVLRRFHQHFKQTVAPLSAYLKPLQSGSFAFISHLKFAGTCMIGSSELLHLPTLANNLGILEIIEPSVSSLPFPRLSDRLVKAWSLHEDPFPRLKVLRVHTDGSLSQDCLQYVTQFPALAMFELLGARMDRYSTRRLAREHGWIYVRSSAARSGTRVAGDTYFPEDTDPQTCESWLRLTQATGTSARANADTDIGAHGYEIYTQLEQQPVPTALQGTTNPTHVDTPLPPSSSSSSSPFVSLTLGQDRQTTTGADDPSANTLFFWRYWDRSGPDGLESHFSPAGEDAVVRPIPGGPPPMTKKAKPRGEVEGLGKIDNKRKAPGPAGSTLRPRKKLRIGSVGEALSLFQGR